MMLLLKKIVMCATALLLLLSVEAQKTNTKKKNKPKDEEVEIPPPPQEELIEVRIDTSSSSEEKLKPLEFSKADFFFNMPDTSTAPADELTAEVRKILTITNALELGVEFAKLMNTENEEERGGLPKIFYQRMYEEFSTGETRKIFENEMIKLYRKYYTLEDAKALVAFYSSPIGKKLISNLPLILSESQKVGEGFGRVLGMKVYNQLLKEGKIN